jgi:hypothetical protein
LRRPIQGQASSAGRRSGAKGPAPLWAVIGQRCADRLHGPTDRKNSNKAPRSLGQHRRCRSPPPSRPRWIGTKPGTVIGRSHAGFRSTMLVMSADEPSCGRQAGASRQPDLRCLAIRAHIVLGEHQSRHRDRGLAAQVTCADTGPLPGRPDGQARRGPGVASRSVRCCRGPF